MTGTVLAIHVEDGQSVAEGDTVAVISAMKMERKLRADRTGTVADVSVVEGDSVEQGALILRVE
jgi:biotin carboxyl carrier protein